MTDMLTCELVSSVKSMRSQTVTATRSRMASSSRRLGSVKLMISGMGASAMVRSGLSAVDRERPKQLERPREIFRRGRSECQRLARSGVPELEFDRVECLP